MQPRFTYFEAKTVIGLRNRFVSALSPNADNMKVIPPMWERFDRRQDELKARKNSQKLGVVIPIVGPLKIHPDEMIYMACAEVENTNVLPAGMVPDTVPAGNYAVFTHKGKLDTLSTTLDYIFNTWLGESKRVLRNAPQLEIYDQRYNPLSDTSEFEIAVPVD